MFLDPYILSIVAKYLVHDQLNLRLINKDFIKINEPTKINTIVRIHNSLQAIGVKCHRLSNIAPKTASYWVRTEAYSWVLKCDISDDIKRIITERILVGLSRS